MVMATPDLVIGAEPYPGASRSEEILRHPRLRSLQEQARGADSGPDWICGTPHVVQALAEMARFGPRSRRPMTRARFSSAWRLSVLVLFVLSLLTGPAGFGPGESLRRS
jgi:hypothetical protein